MELNELKDRLFNLLNESDTLDLLDLHLYDRENVLILEFPDGSSFELRCTMLSAPTGSSLSFVSMLEDTQIIASD